jgi:pantoate--beta-alanine ligase
MGALHEGHLTLVRTAMKQAGHVVCSIFVNPAQFNDPVDLENYPRTPGKDIALLTELGCDVLFMPPISEVYPPRLTFPPLPDLGYLPLPMEGAHRPGHFEGMARVVRRLLDIVQPDSLFMGQKDFQQVAIVKNMLQQINSSARLVCCPTVREADGVAMSSRNARLTAAQRAIAPLIFRTLKEAKQVVFSKTPAIIETESLEKLARGGLVPEYFEIVEGNSLQRLTVVKQEDFAVACVAVKLGEVRLIDNMILNEPAR